MAILNDIVDERGDVHRECGNAYDDTTISTKLISSVECQPPSPINDTLVGDNNISADDLDIMSDHCADNN